MLNRIKCHSCKATLLFARLESGVIELRCRERHCRKVNRIQGVINGLESIVTVSIPSYVPTLLAENVV